MRSNDMQAPAGLLTASLADLMRPSVSDLTDQHLSAELKALLAARRTLDALIYTRLDEFDTRGLSEQDGLRTTRTWLTAFGLMSQGAASATLARSRLLRDLPTLARVAIEGQISAEHLGPICKLARQVGVERLLELDATLAEFAASNTPAEVRRACAQIRDNLEPGTTPGPDADHQRRGLSVFRSGNLMLLRGRLDAEAGSALLTALDALTMPASGQDERTPTQRRADALAELARQSLSHARCGTVGGVRPQVGILVTPDTLKSQGCSATTRPGSESMASTAGAPWLSWFGETSGQTAQRLACDSEIWRVVLDPDTGLPLDVGRTRRVVPHHLRRALHARDRGCRWPGCEAPTAWTDAHHLTPWYAGGSTDIVNLALLCRYHHTKVHEGRWQVRLDPRTGEFHVTRPDGTPYGLSPSQPWLSPDRRRVAQPETAVQPPSDAWSDERAQHTDPGEQRPVETDPQRPGAGGDERESHGHGATTLVA
ncbi:MAG TPA: DUF222 domain-containing protein [Micromonosporaceae bacterium]